MTITKNAILYVLIALTIVLVMSFATNAILTSPDNWSHNTGMGADGQPYVPFKTDFTPTTIFLSLYFSTICLSVGFVVGIIQFKFRTKRYRHDKISLEEFRMKVKQSYIEFAREHEQKRREARKDLENHGKRRCISCFQIKTLEEFPQFKYGRAYLCSPCYRENQEAKRMRRND